MKTKAGRPSSSKKTIDVKDLDGEIVHVTIKLPREMHKKIVMKKLDGEGDIGKIIIALIEKGI